MYSSPVDFAGIYVHIPFCIKKCLYCDFYSTTDQYLKEAFYHSLLNEINSTRNISLSFDSIYIGGGTPSLLEHTHIAGIIENIYKQNNILRKAEITIEINPGAVSPELLKEYIHCGINRIIIGVQSFNNKYLKFLGRIHSDKDAKYIISLARKAGFNNIGIDLIYGIPSQKKESWINDLKQAVQFEPDHISCYILTYEHGTPLHTARKAGKFRALSGSTIRDMFLTTIDFLNSYGYKQYEISNFSRYKKKRSRHNQKYWSFSPYIGLGPSSHSFIEPVRFWNIRSVKEYINRINFKKSVLAEKEVLNTKQLIIEAVYLGLRKTGGINLKAFYNKFGVKFDNLFEKKIMILKQKGYIKTGMNSYALTRKGMLSQDSVTAFFIG